MNPSDQIQSPRVCLVRAVRGSAPGGEGGLQPQPGRGAGHQQELQEPALHQTLTVQYSTLQYSTVQYRTVQAASLNLAEVLNTNRNCRNPPFIKL